MIPPPGNSSSWRRGSREGALPAAMAGRSSDVSPVIDALSCAVLGALVGLSYSVCWCVGAGVE